MPDIPGPDTAAVRYQRVTAAVAALGELSAGRPGARLAAVLAGDEVVSFRMHAALAVLGAAELPAGLPDPSESDPRDWTGSELAEAAARWHRHACGEASELHRACAADVARGLLRLWARRQQPAPQGAVAGRVRRRQARIALLGLVRTRCVALRTELRDDAAALTRRRMRDFPDHVSRRVAAVTGELIDEVDWELPGAEPAGRPPAGVPVPRVPAAEGRLTAVFGAVFGLGAALTLARALSGLMPGWPAAMLSAAVGLGLAGWVLGTRRVLARRAALDRWVVELIGGLRADLEERIATRALAAEAAGPRPARTAGGESSPDLRLTP